MRNAVWTMVLGAGLAAFPAHGDEADRDRRLRELEQAMARMQKELEELRREGRQDEEEIRVKALEEQVEDLRNKEKKDEKNGTPLRAFYKDGIKLKSDDGSFDLSVGGRIIENGRFFVGSNPNDDTFYNKETQIELKGKVFKRFRYEIEANVTNASTLNNSFVEFEANEHFGIKMGQFKEPILYEETSSTLWRDFGEKSIATRLAPSRDIGIQIGGKLMEKKLAYELGYFNGSGKNASDANDDKDWAGRLTLAPFAGNPGHRLHKLQVFGYGSWGRQDSVQPNGGTAGAFTMPDTGTQFLTFQTNVRNAEDRTRHGGGATFAKGPFSLKGEFISMSMDLEKTASSFDQAKNTRFDAWYLTLGWVITGEDAMIFNRINPKKPFNKGGWGAWEVVGRVSGFQAEREPFFNLERQNGGTTSYASSPQPTSSGVGSATEVASYTFGVNWTPISNAKLLFNYGENYYAGGDYVGALGADVRGTERYLMLSTQFDF